MASSLSKGQSNFVENVLTLFSMALLVALKSMFSDRKIGTIMRCMWAMKELSTGESRPSISSMIAIDHIRCSLPVVTEEPMKLITQV